MNRDNDLRASLSRLDRDNLLTQIDVAPAQLRTIT
jgi:hypothetical protein